MISRPVLCLVALFASFALVQAQEAEESPIGSPVGSSTEQDPTTEPAPALSIRADVPAMTVPAGCERVGEPGAVAPIAEGGELPGGMPEHGRRMVEAVTQIHARMVGSMMAENPDLAFACAMIAYHQAAINMADVELSHGENDELRQTARDMIETHRGQIETLSRWVAENAP